MFTAADLQNSKAFLKRSKPKPPKPADIARIDPTPTSILPQPAAKAGIPLPPPISLVALQSTRGSLYKVSTLPRKAVQNGPPEADDESNLTLPAFARRKELFERQKTSNTSTLPATVVVRVGQTPETKAFTVDRRTLRSSPRFRDELPNLGEGLEELRLIDHSPRIFQLYLDFCQKPDEPPIKYQPGLYSAEPWATSCVAAYLLAVDLRSRRFERYALSQFIQNCAVMVKSPWRQIEDCAIIGSPLERFSRHWVAWNTSLSNWWGHEYIGLSAAKLGKEVTSDTPDPRILDLDHWYQSCSENFSASCEHSPIHRLKQQQRQARESRPPPAEWGADRERQSWSAAYN